MSSTVTKNKRLSRLAALAVALVALPAVLAGHEVPNEVTVQGYIKPDGTLMTMLLRVPMKSLRDIEVPTLQNGFLDYSRLDQALNDASTLWLRDYVELYENGLRLASPKVAGIRVSLPGDQSFASYDAALTNILTGARLQQGTDIYWDQGMLDVAYEFPIGSDQSDFAIRPALTRLGLRVNVVLQFLQPGKPERVFDVHADTGIVHLDPRWHQAFYLFARDGFFHILDGTDHLLFLLCLVIPFRKLRPLALVVTAFTVAHSVTLIASAYGMAPDSLWFPPLIETLIAISIVYMAFENIVGAKLERRWIVTFAFGLIHGFGFSFLLRERLQFAGEHLVMSLLAFNVGVEIGQLAVLLVTIPVLGLIFRYVVPERIGTILMSALVAHTAWHWATERGSVLLTYRFPALDVSDFAAIIRLAMVIVGAGFVMWLLSLWIGKPKDARRAEP
ncbi:MAG: HupE/UreJ family protein [Acidobacteria bacterium]|nr:HupE/UreJ family protein [Acidobacteriota bacterium]MSO62335.1 HupE/UreJ family protein [Acidobacteriota bacterium]